MFEGPPGVSPAILNLDSMLSRVDRKGFECLKHEGHQLIPPIEGQVLEQGTEMFKEGPPRGQNRTHRPITFIHPIQHGMAQVGQQNHRCQHGREMLPTVTIVVLEVIAFGFQDVIVFILDLPAAATGGYEFSHGVIGNRVSSHPGVGVHHLPGRGCGREFAPIDQPRIVAVAQGHWMHIAVGVDEPLLPRPLPPISFS